MKGDLADDEADRGQEQQKPPHEREARFRGQDKFRVNKQHWCVACPETSLTPCLPPLAYLLLCPSSAASFSPLVRPCPLSPSPSQLALASSQAASNSNFHTPQDFPMRSIQDVERASRAIATRWTTPRPGAASAEHCRLSAAYRDTAGEEKVGATTRLRLKVSPLSRPVSPERQLSVCCSDDRSVTALSRQRWYQKVVA